MPDKKKAVEDLMLDLTKSVPIERKMALEQIQKLPADKSVLALDAVLAVLQHDDNDEVRKWAAETLGKLGERINAPRGIIAGEEDVVGLMEVGMKSMIAGPLRQILMDGSDSEAVRISVVRALGSIGGPEVAKVLVDAINDSTLTKPIQYDFGDSYGVVNSIVDAAGRTKDSGAVTPLMNLWAGTPNNDVRTHIAGALGSIGDARATSMLIAAVGEKDHEDLRRAAAKALVDVRAKYEGDISQTLLKSATLYHDPELMKCYMDYQKKLDVIHEKIEDTARQGIGKLPEKDRRTALALFNKVTGTAPVVKWAEKHNSDEEKKKKLTTA